MSFYSLVQLERDQSIFIEGDSLFVDLDKADLGRIIDDDESFNRSISDNRYFWVSGGGTYFINNRYLLLVKRREDARVNPGKYSLFTGRADSIKELTAPDMLTRELFEELVLFSGEDILYPLCSRYQDIIDCIYSDLKRKDIYGNATRRLSIRQINEFEKLILLKYQGKQHNLSLNYHINKRNDINILFLFSAEVDIDALSAVDGEYHTEKSEIVWHRRDIYIYDIMTSDAWCITNTDRDRKKIAVDESDMTEHALYMVGLVRVYINRIGG